MVLSAYMFTMVFWGTPRMVMMHRVGDVHSRHASG